SFIIKCFLLYRIEFLALFPEISFLIEPKLTRPREPSYVHETNYMSLFVHLLRFYSYCIMLMCYYLIVILLLCFLYVIVMLLLLCYYLICIMLLWYYLMVIFLLCFLYVIVMLLLFLFIFLYTNYFLRYKYDEESFVGFSVSWIQARLWSMIPISGLQYITYGLNGFFNDKQYEMFVCFILNFVSNLYFL
ncbi:hypothetical protein L9F63_000592, partial [Diploptera punctata]